MTHLDAYKIVDLMDENSKEGKEARSLLGLIESFDTVEFDWGLVIEDCGFSSFVTVFNVVGTPINAYAVFSDGSALFESDKQDTLVDGGIVPLLQFIYNALKRCSFDSEIKKIYDNRDEKAEVLRCGYSDGTVLSGFTPNHMIARQENHGYIMWCDTVAGEWLEVGGEFAFVYDKAAPIKVKEKEAHIFTLSSLIGYNGDHEPDDPPLTPTLWGMI